MSFATWLGLAIVFLLLALMIAFRVALRARPGHELRLIRPYWRLQRALSEAVESGQQIHITLGHGEMTGPRSAAGIIGLTAAERIGQMAAVADQTPVVSSGTGALGLLAQGILHATFAESGAASRYRPDLAPVVGLTPYAYAAGAMLIAAQPSTATTVMLGSLGPEAALIADAAEQNQQLVVAGTDHVPTQAVLYAAAEEPLIGEEIFAAGAYLGKDPLHNASLQAQDVLRWVLIGAMVLGGLLNLIGGWW